MSNGREPQFSARIPDWLRERIKREEALVGDEKPSGRIDYGARGIMLASLMIYSQLPESVRVKLAKRLRGLRSEGDMMEALQDDGILTLMQRFAELAAAGLRPDAPAPKPNHTGGKPSGDRKGSPSVGSKTRRRGNR